MSRRLAFHLVALLLVFALPGCVTDRPLIEDTLEEFEAGVRELIQPGIPWKDAHEALLVRFPRPSEDSEATPMVGARGFPGRNRRFVMLWRTTTPGVAYVLTVECDRNLVIARVIVGPLYENH
jgi:hypothetical protein